MAFRVQMRPPVRLGILLSLAFFSLSCSAPLPATPGRTGAAAVRLTVEPQEEDSSGYLLTLENHSRRALGYNLCRSVLERQSGDDWVEVPPQPDCKNEMRALTPGNSDSLIHHRAQPLEPGIYRFRTTIERPLGDAPAPLSTESFAVEEQVYIPAES
jgi:hypothetical protein